MLLLVPDVFHRVIQTHGSVAPPEPVSALPRMSPWSFTYNADPSPKSTIPVFSDQKNA